MTRFRRFAANRGVTVATKVAERFVEAAREALATAEADVSRDILVRDLQLLDTLNADVALAEEQLERLLPSTPFGVLTTVLGWAVPRVGRYGAAVGDAVRWPGAAQLHRASGLTPNLYESSANAATGPSAAEDPSSYAARFGPGMGPWLRHGCSHPPAGMAP